MTAETARGLGGHLQPAALAIAGPTMTKDQETRLSNLEGSIGGADVYVERGYHDQYSVIFILLAVIGGLMVLVGSLTATGLAMSRVPPRPGHAGAVGAAPRTRRIVGGAQAVVIGLIGTVLGVGLGFVPGLAVTWPLTAQNFVCNGQARAVRGGGPVIAIPWLLLGRRRDRRAGAGRTGHRAVHPLAAADGPAAGDMSGDLTARAALERRERRSAAARRALTIAVRRVERERVDAEPVVASFDDASPRGGRPVGQRPRVRRRAARAAGRGRWSRAFVRTSRPTARSPMPTRSTWCCCSGRATACPKPAASGSSRSSRRWFATAWTAACRSSASVTAPSSRPTRSAAR